METTRLEAFSDGVFAIAITLLIIEVRLPAGGGPLARRLAEAWPDYLAYVVSFVTIGVMWANHHSLFHLIARCTHGLVVANALLRGVAVGLTSAGLIATIRRFLQDDRGHAA